MSYHVYIAYPGFKETPIPLDAWLTAARQCNDVVVEERKNRHGKISYSVTLKGGDKRAWLDLDPYGLVVAQDPSKELVVAMKRSNPISKALIAPCGMNCAICSRYLASVHNLKRSKCLGCRPRNERCTYLFGKCRGINHAVRGGDAVYCFECAYYPCAQINRMDNRYRKNYSMSIKENLENIKSAGVGAFIKEQYKKYRCSKCGGLISIHNRKCFNCDRITKLVDISSRRRNGKKKAGK